MNRDKHTDLHTSITKSESHLATVLCVDDDPNISEAIARTSVRHGIRVVRAYLGIEGFLKAITENPDVIILDVAMPKGQGTEILECGSTAF